MGLDRQVTKQPVGQITMSRQRWWAPSPSQLGFTRVGHLRLSKSDISDFDRERVGVRGYGLSIERNPSPGSHPKLRHSRSIASAFFFQKPAAEGGLCLSHKGRGDTERAEQCPSPTADRWQPSIGEQLGLVIYR
jgi:hypothetical protein